MEIEIKKILSSELALFRNEGLKINKMISREFNKNLPVILNFDGIERCSNQFLNVVIGTLYLEFDSKIVDLNLVYKCIDKNLHDKIQDVKTNALNHEVYNSLVAYATS